jgi:hypothetical protein
MKAVSLSKDVEACVLSAMMAGSYPLDAVKPDEMHSPEGRAVLGALKRVGKRGTSFPVSSSVIYTLATTALGADKRKTGLLVKRMQAAQSGVEIEDLVSAVRSRELLRRIVNTATLQYAEGTFDLGAVTALLAEERSSSAMESIAGLLKDGLPGERKGWKLRSLRKIHEATGGLFGIWAVGGEPGLGKSTLAMQIALDVALQGATVLFFDLDGTGQRSLARWAGMLVGPKKAVRLLKRVYLRESIGSLDSDLAVAGPNAVVVVDSFQTLPANLLNHRLGLDAWLGRFKAMEKRKGGPTFLLVSEKNQASFGKAGLGSFKETGEIAYAASMGALLVGDPTDDDEETNEIKFVIVKNRHRPKKGRVTWLKRDKEKVYLFKEVDGGF